MSPTEKMKLKNVCKGYKYVMGIVLSILEGNGLIVSGQSKYYRFYRADTLAVM